MILIDNGEWIIDNYEVLQFQCSICNFVIFAYFLILVVFSNPL